MIADVLLPAAFVAGFFGSAHCLGMCGAIVVLFEQQAGAAAGWQHRLVYNLGRLGFYALLGSIAGAGGAVINRVAGIDIGLVILRLVAGMLVIAIGLNLLFSWSATRFLEQAGAGLWRRLSPLAKHVLPVSTPPRAFAAGLLWGALPCGLVYSTVALAGTSGGPVGGALAMAAFWAGTAPAMILAGSSASLLTAWQSNRTFRRIAGVTMLVIGLFALMPARMLTATM